MSSLNAVARTFVDRTSSQRHCGMPGRYASLVCPCNGEILIKPGNIMDMTEAIHHGHLSTFASQYHVCRKCRSVDAGMSQVIVGSPCPECGVPSPGGLTFFDFSVLTIAELLQQAYLAIPEKAGDPLHPLSDTSRVHSASVVIMFCTLKELLLERFLSALMQAQNLPQAVCDRLFSDNSSHSQRLSKLFPTLTSLTWDNALSTIDPQGSSQFGALSQFMKTITDVRNNFVHEGGYFDINKDLATEALRNFMPMLELFVALHNVHVHPFYFGGKPTNA